MRKKPPSRSDAIDVFEDDDLSQAQALLSGDTAPPEGNVKHGAMAISPPTSLAETRSIAATRPNGHDSAGEEAHAGGAAPVPVPHVEPTSSHLKLRVRQTTRARFDAFRGELSVALGGVRVTDSNLGRAIIDWFLENGVDEVVECARGRVLRRPPSDDVAGMAAFDEALVETIEEALGAARDASKKWP